MTKTPHTFNHSVAIWNRSAARALAVLLVGLATCLGTWGAETVFARSAGNWPANRLELAQLAALSFLLGLGLLTALVVAGRMVGYRRRIERAREAQFARLAEEALTDSLTGLGNHRAFYETLNREIARRQRTGSRFAIVMLDLDGLKQVNDTLGHQAGDERIRATAHCVRASMRASDSAYRVGGDEFMVLLPDEQAWEAFTFAQRLHRATDAHRTALSVTCGIAESIGVDTTDALIRNVDLALYEAKRSERRVVIYADCLTPRPAAQPAERATRHHQRLLATALARAVDAKDQGTRNHCETVSELCVLIGQELRLDPDRLERIRLAGLLHDVGKIGVADRILRKAGPLEVDEAAAMREHVQVGYSVVEAAELVEEAHWVLHHHEHVDGSGYPHGLRGDEIPLESRIILVADAFEAITAERPYSPSTSVHDALAELDAHAGSQFDVACVKALRTALGRNLSKSSQVEAA